MENQLIHVYLFVCLVYGNFSNACFQRSSNNSKPVFTDEELLTIWFFAHLHGCFETKQMYTFIQNYWSDWFSQLPAYQTFVHRLNLLEPTFQTVGGVLSQSVTARSAPEIDRIVDSLPVMLAANGHSYTARVARDIANAGYCAVQENSLSRRPAARRCRSAVQNTGFSARLRTV